MYVQNQRNSRRRPGAVLVLTCISLVGILFLTALAIDSGNMMSQRRHAQNCADASALAGCIYLAKAQANGTAFTVQDIKNAANVSASNNGYVDPSNCTITVNRPPTSGSYQNNNSVEVLLSFTYNNMIVGGSNTVTVRSVASCDAATAPFRPMLLLEPSAPKSFWVKSATLTLDTVTTHVNSSSATAAVVEGSGAAANAALQAVGNSSGNFTPTTKSNLAPINDPYALLAEPDRSLLPTKTQSRYYPSGGNITLDPGYYPNGLYCIDGGNVTMNPGVYYVENGNFWINTPGTVNAEGVLVYHNGANNTALLKQWYNLDNGIVLCPSNNDYNFTPPSTGTHAGVSFFQGRDCTSTAFYDFWGSGDVNTGIQYFPKSTLRCWARNGTINCNELVAKNYKLVGAHELYGNTQNGGFSYLTWNASRATNRPATNIALVE